VQAPAQGNVVEVPRVVGSITNTSGERREPIGE